MIILRTQPNRSFDRKFVFTALHQRFICIHLFYSHLIPIHRDLFLFAQYQVITHLAPKGDLLAPPVQRQRRAILHLIYSIGRQVYLNQSMILVSIQGTQLRPTSWRHPSCRRRKHDRDRRLL
jgi:hypothetical protein